jgi:hypothetical protein
MGHYADQSPHFRIINMRVSTVNCVVIHPRYTARSQT